MYLAAKSNHTTLVHTERSGPTMAESFGEPGCPNLVWTDLGRIPCRGSKNWESFSADLNSPHIMHLLNFRVNCYVPSSPAGPPPVPTACGTSLLHHSPQVCSWPSNTEVSDFSAS
jgi:hypothetical protein